MLQQCQQPRLQQSCILRRCLQAIEAHALLFVHKCNAADAPQTVLTMLAALMPVRVCPSSAAQ